MILESLQQRHLALFGSPNVSLFFAPGRVNLIGEHIDYNGGHVLPCALEYGTYACLSLRHDKQIYFFSEDFSTDIVKLSLDNLIKLADNSWLNYPIGVIKIFADNNYKLANGFNINFYGNLPRGSGLSSSASIEVLMALILNNIGNFKLDNIEIAKLSRLAENAFIGVSCGIMDQFASSMGQENSAILLNCNSLSYRYIPLKLGNYTLVIANTNKARSLASSKYNERFNQCQMGLKILQKHLPIKNLVEAKLVDLKHVQDKIIYRRLKHVITEELRVQEAVQVLSKNDLIAFGKLMNQSHESLRDDYEVTGMELDTLAEAAWHHSNCIGARMTGAGFGGCIVSLVEKDCATNFIEEVKYKYHSKIGIMPEFYITQVGNGACELKHK